MFLKLTLKKIICALALLICLSSCSGKDIVQIKVDGSSTVFPITELIVENYREVSPKTRIPVGISGSGGGISKFIAGEIDLVNSSRAMKESELEQLKVKNVEVVELEVAYDGLSVIVNKNNDWVDYLTVDELNSIWKAGSKIKLWSDIRSDWPTEEIKFFAPGTDSGTFDYFTEEINGESGNIRVDFTASEDDNILATGISGSVNSIGFFGYAYYEDNKDNLRIVPIDNGNGPITPNFDTISNGTYSPLSRPLFLYTSKEKIQDVNVSNFLEYYLTNAKETVGSTGYIPLLDSEYQEQLEKLN